MPHVHARTCHLCEANCGILMEMEGARALAIRPDRDDPLSRGHICPKVVAILDLEDDPDRLRAPLRRTAAGWQEVDWEDAMADIGRRMAAIVQGGDAAALYAGNPNAHNYATGMALPALRKAMGRPQVYSSGTVDQIPHQLVQMEMYGHNALFPVPDVDRAQTMMIVGGNPLASNGSVWTVPDVRRRLEALKARGGTLITVDPRRTETAGIASEHVFLRPGADPAFLAGLLLALDRAGLVAPGRLAPMLDEGWGAAWARLRAFDAAALAGWSGVTVERLDALARRLAGGGPAIVYGRMGVSVHAFGTLNHWLIQLLNIALGSLDAEGGTLFSTPAVDLVATTGPGSRGRRHTRVSQFPDIMGEFPAVALAEEIDTPGEGQVRGLVVVAGNPVLSNPDGRRLDRALAGLELMVSVDMYVTATSRHAHYVLPPAGPLARDHYPLLLAPIAIRNFAKYSPPARAPAPGERRDFEIVHGLAAAIAVARGEPPPPLPDPPAILDRMLRAGPHGLSLAALAPHPHGLDLGPLSPGRLPARLRTPDQRIRCAPPDFLADLDRLTGEVARPPAPGLRLIGRRHVRSNNSWMHNAPRLAKGPDRARLMIHPADAARRGIDDGARVRLSSETGAVEAVAQLTDEVMEGVVSLPHGWGHDRPGERLAVAAANPGASANDLTSRRAFDPLSGNAVLNGMAVEVAAARARLAAE